MNVVQQCERLRHWAVFEQEKKTEKFVCIWDDGLFIAMYRDYHSDDDDDGERKPGG